MMRSVFLLLAIFVSSMAACSLTVDLPEPTSVGPGTGGGGEGGGEVPECMGSPDCPVPENVCETAFCAAGICGTVAAPQDANARVDDPENDLPCQTLKCDGLGATYVIDDDDDIKDDRDPCTDDSCLGGSPVHRPKELGDSCVTEMIPTGVCDASATCVQCLGPEDCTQLAESNECRTRMCVNGQCMLDLQPDGFVLPTQSPGDCQRRECNGEGLVREVDDDTDGPNDGNDCTADSCVQGAPAFVDESDGTGCGLVGVCNNGSCVGCNSVADCGTPPNSCVALACNNNTCDVSYAPVGTEVDIDPNDCLTITCGMNGALNNDADNAELPTSDNNDCTADMCLGGVANYQNKSQNETCSSGGGSFCDGAGSCVECNSPTQCSNPIGGCEERTCNANQCGVGDTPSGQLSTSQVNFDCQVEVCDGMGMSQPQPQDTDLPVDGNQCTNDVCMSGMASNPPAAAGTACTQGGNVCNGTGTCIDCIVDGDCPQGYCDGMVCAQTLNLGSTCNRGAMCTSGNCADGVCCDTACAGTCVACVLGKTGQTSGKCANITSNTDPDKECSGRDVCIGGVCCPPLSVEPVPLCPAKL